MGSRAHVVLAELLSALKDTLRVASRYPPGVPPSEMHVDLLDLSPAVALASCINIGSALGALLVRYLTGRLGNRKKGTLLSPQGAL